MRPAKAFDLSTDRPLLKPIFITVDISAADTRFAESDVDNILIQHHRDGRWVPLKTNVDFNASTATSRVEHLSIFTLTVKEPDPTDIDFRKSSRPSSSNEDDVEVPPNNLVPFSTVTSAETAYRNGVSAYENKQYQLAVYELTAAIQLEPNVRNYYWYRGLTNGGLDRLDEAIEDYNSAISA